MNIKDISTQLLYTTVPIYAKKQDGSFSSGTGFIFSVMEEENRSIPLLITNYHVLCDAVAGFVELHIAEDGMPSEKSIRVQFDKSIISGNKLGELDLIAVPLAATLNEFQQKGINAFYRTVNQNMIPKQTQIYDFAAIEDITFIGYPSGLYDNVNKLPIIRNGITIGSRLLFIGVISETMVRNESATKSYLDLGKVINSSAMYNEVENFIQRIR